MPHGGCAPGMSMLPRSAPSPHVSPRSSQNPSKCNPTGSSPAPGPLQEPGKGLAMLGTHPGHQHRYLAGRETLSRAIWKAWEHPPATPEASAAHAPGLAESSHTHVCRCSATSEWCHGLSPSALVQAGAGSAGTWPKPPRGSRSTPAGPSPRPCRAALGRGDSCEGWNLLEMALTHHRPGQAARLVAKSNQRLSSATSRPCHPASSLWCPTATGALSLAPHLLAMPSGLWSKSWCLP